MARRQPLTLMVFLALAAFFSVSYLFSSSPRKAYEYEPGPVPVRAHEPAPAPEAAPQAVPEVAPLAKDSTLSSLQSTHDDHDDHDAHDDHDDTSDDEEHHHSDEDGHDSGVDLSQIDSKILKGESIAPKLENATARAELGRASWKLFHTMMARFPEKPTEDDSKALSTYIHLFARLYPCGDCARHFRGLLEEYPPQVSSRNAAAGWACFVHNEVNQRLEKPLFDCNNIGDFYDCGCGEEKKEGEEEEDDSEGESVEDES